MNDSDDEASQLYLLALTMAGPGPPLAARWRSGNSEGRRKLSSLKRDDSSGLRFLGSPQPRAMTNLPKWMYLENGKSQPALL